MIKTLPDFLKGQEVVLHFDGSMNLIEVRGSASAAQWAAEAYGKVAGEAIPGGAVFVDIAYKKNNAVLTEWWDSIVMGLVPIEVYRT